MNVDSKLLSFVNGIQEKKISVADRGLAYGHGLFETIRVSKGAIPLLEYHILRLLRGAKIIGIKADRELIEKYIYQLLEASPEEGVIKIIVTAGSSQRGYFYNKNNDTYYVTQWFPAAVVDPPLRKKGIALKYCKHRLPHSPILAGIKHLNRLDQIIARSEWSEEFHDGLVLDQDDNVIECTSSNIFVYKNGVWMTPKINRCGVSGVMREYLICNLIPGAGSNVMEVNMPLEVFLSSDEVFICNSVTGIFPVVSVENLCEFESGLATKKINEELCKEFSCYE